MTLCLQTRVMTHTPCQSQRPWFSPVKPDLNNTIREIIVELFGIRFNTFARYDWMLPDDRWDRKKRFQRDYIPKLQFTLWDRDGPQALSSHMLICINITHVNPRFILHSIKVTFTCGSSWWFIDWQTKFGIITICDRNLLCSPAAFIWSNILNFFIYIWNITI